MATVEDARRHRPPKPSQPRLPTSPSRDWNFILWGIIAIGLLAVAVIDNIYRNPLW